MVVVCVYVGAGELKRQPSHEILQPPTSSLQGDAESTPLVHSLPCFLSLSSLLLWRPCWAMRWCRLPVGPLMCWPCPLSENYLPGAVEMAVSSPACSSFWLDLNTPAMIYSLHTHLPPRGLFSPPPFFSLIPFFFFHSQIFIARLLCAEC